MSPPGEFFSSLRRSRRYPSGKAKRSPTNNTLNQWVDIDPHTGQSTLLDVNRPDGTHDPHRFSGEAEAGPSTALYPTWQREHEGAGARLVSLPKGTFKRLNTDDDGRESRGERLKRRSIQLLKMVGGDGRKNSTLSTSGIQITHPHYDDRSRPSTSTISRPSFSVDSHHHTYPQSSSTSPSSQLDTPATPPHEWCDHPESMPSMNILHLPILQTQQYDHIHPDQTPRRHHPISSSHTAAGDENTPPNQLHNCSSDSDSSGKRPTLRPHRSVVPNNTPLSNISVTACDSPADRITMFNICSDNQSNGTPPSWLAEHARRRLTFDALINDPLPPPNDEPSRYTVPLTAFENMTLAPSEISGENESAPAVDPDELRGYGHLEQWQDRFEDAQGEEGMTERSSALEALWEYGSSVSSLEAEDEQGEATEYRCRRDDAGRGMVGDEVELDMQVSADEYPLPPSMTQGTKGVPPEHMATTTAKLAGDGQNEGRAHNLSASRSADHGHGHGIGHYRSQHRMSQGFPSHRSLTATATRTITAAQEIDTQAQSRNKYHTDMSSSSSHKALAPSSRGHHRARSSIATSSALNPLSSPLSDDLSLPDEYEYDDVDEAVVSHGLAAYRIPLKFERPEARRRSSLSVASPFVELYRATDPQAVE